MTNKEALEFLFEEAQESALPEDERGYLIPIEQDKLMERMQVAHKQLATVVASADMAFPNVIELAEGIEKAIIRYADERVTQGAYWPEWHGEGVDSDHVENLKSAIELACDLITEQLVFLNKTKYPRHHMHFNMFVDSELVTENYFWDGKWPLVNQLEKVTGHSDWTEEQRIVTPLGGWASYAREGQEAHFFVTNLTPDGFDMIDAVNELNEGEQS